MECLGDVNNDGYDDFLVGAPSNGGGKAFIYLGSLTGPKDTYDWRMEGESDGDGFGWGDCAGDINNDGFDEVIIAARNNDDGGNDAGKVYLYEYNGTKSILTLESAPTYHQGDLVTINATYTNDSSSANITFQVKDPDDSSYAVKTLETDAGGNIQYEFRLGSDVTTGTWSVIATNDKDDATDTITFEVLEFVEPEPPHLILRLLDVPSSVSKGGTLSVDFTIENTFDTAKTVTLVLQVEDPQLTPLEPTIEVKSVPASAAPTYTLSVNIPSDADTPAGTYAVQGQMLTELPENAGYALAYEDTTVSVS